jgi:hypothetical protein
MTVYKTALFDNLPNFKKIRLPKGAKILSFHMQRGVFCVWWLGEFNITKSEEWEIIIIGTGNDFGEDKFGVDDTYTFIGTDVFGQYVAHCFVKKLK